jgi:hypothetical protein
VGQLGEYSIYKLREVNEDLSKYIEKKDHSIINNSNLASLAKRDVIYSEMIKQGYLTPTHQKYLSEYGLDNSGYMSIEHRIRYHVPKHVMAALGIDELEGIPGFGMKKNNWFLAGSNGIAMPCITLDESLNLRKSGFQIRSDDEDSFLRYSWESSLNYERGSSIKGDCANHKIHIAFPSNISNVSYIGITEGIKKADIAALYLNQIVLGLTGVASQGGILIVLERLLALIGENKDIPIRIGFDADMNTNPRVMAAYILLVKTLREARYTRLQKILWDDQYKGIDDFLAKKSKKELKGIAV